MASAYSSEHKPVTLSSSQTTGSFLLRVGRETWTDLRHQKEKQTLCVIRAPPVSRAYKPRQRWPGWPPRMKMPQEKPNELVVEHHCLLNGKEIPFKENI